MTAIPSTTSTASAVIRMLGKDSLDILHRIGTQKVDDLASGEARATLFCDFRGRVLHRAWVVQATDGSVWLVRDDAASAPLLDYIDKHVFREDVRLEDLSSERRVTAVPFDTWDNPYGLANQVGALHMQNDVPAAIVDAHGFVLVISPPSETVQADGDVEHAHVEAGRPRQGHEITDRFNPYEIGLAPNVHLSKGCYTGQEALQRLITFESVKRQLARLKGDGAAPAVGDELRAEGREVGIVTTALADGNGWHGLAAVRLDALEVAAALPDGRAVRMEPLDPGRPVGRA